MLQALENTDRPVMSQTDILTKFSLVIDYVTAEHPHIDFTAVRTKMEQLQDSIPHSPTDEDASTDENEEEPSDQARTRKEKEERATKGRAILLGAAVLVGGGLVYFLVVAKRE